MSVFLCVVVRASKSPKITISGIKGSQRRRKTMIGVNLDNRLWDNTCKLRIQYWYVIELKVMD